MQLKYNLVDTMEKLKELDTLLMDGDTPKHRLLAFDTETNGLDLYKSTVVGFSISFNKDQGFYIPILVWDPDKDSAYVRTFEKEKYDAFKTGKLKCIWTGERFDEFVTPQEFNLRERVPLIPALLERWLTKTNLYMWNASFDINHVWINAGVELKDSLFLDGSLLVHILDENESVGLKSNAERYRDYLGINPHAHAAMEKKELNSSIIVNGGRPGMVWRADIQPQMKYACADTFFTYGICDRALQEFHEQFGDRGMEWLFVKEVMPVCKNVVVDMKRRGVYTDTKYFQKLFDENEIKMAALEDELINEFTSNQYLYDFSMGTSIDEEISNQALVKAIMKREGVPIPVKTDKNTGETKDSIAKAEVKKAFAINPHWIYGYILGEDEIKYSKADLDELKRQMYVEKVGRRYRFNIGSNDHLRWLFCDKLKLDAKKLPQTDSATKENIIPQMGAEVLQEFMLPKFQWVSKLLTWKKLQKLQSTYIKPALELHINGWLYMNMKQNGTTSGRFSCSGGYNLQTLPRVDDELEILEECDKCYSKDIEIRQEIECIADRHCKKCGHVLRDITRPSAIKKGFIAPPGYKIVNADYSSLEPRCFAFMSNEQALKDVYLKGLDLYSQVYCEIFDTEKQYSADPKAPNFLKKVAKAKRTFVKPIVLGIPYGAEDAQVAMLIDAYKEVVDKKTGEVKKVPDYERGKYVRDMYLAKLNKLCQYMDDQDLKAVTYGYVETVVGRRRHLPFAKKIKDTLDRHNMDYLDLKNAYPYLLNKPTVSFVDKRSGKQIYLSEEALVELQKAFGIRDEVLREKGYWTLMRALLKGDLNNSKNNPIQGLAGHITNKGMLEINRRFKEQGVDGWVALQVHDEIMAYVRENDAERGAELLRLGMEQNEFTALVDIPMIAEPTICDNLKDSK